MMSAKAQVEQLAALAGVTINGPALTDPKINDDRAYAAIASGDSLRIGEAYMDTWWDCADLAGLYRIVLDAKLHEQLNFFRNPGLLLRGMVTNMQSRSHAFAVGQQHYDLGNDLYGSMLDRRMVYTSAIWDGVETLEAAQEQKLDRICKQLGLKAGDRVLDIGCGWGSFMKFAAEKYGARCVGLTVSKEQTALGESLCANLPVSFVIVDYRDYTTPEPFDHIVSIEMLEAVGPKNFKTYFNKVYELLKPTGRFHLQTIAGIDAHPPADPWLQTYIFPNGILPSLHQLEQAWRYQFVIEDLKNIGPDYEWTLLEWWRRFDRAYPKLQANNPFYDERFYRMWKYYLQSCAALFRSRQTQDWQMTFTKLV